LKLAVGIPANSSVTIYVGFASTITNLFNGNTTGEAPQLSPTYGQYDNGNKIFAFYDNFAGTTLNSKWTLYGDQTPSVNNGLTSTSQGGAAQGYYIKTSTQSTPLVIEVYAKRNSSSSIIGPEFGEIGQNPIVNFDLDQIDNYYLGPPGNPGITGGSQSVGTMYLISLVLPSTSTEIGLSGYSTILSGTTSFTDNHYVGMQCGDVASTSVFVQWFRTRVYPPNGVMPSVSGFNIPSTPAIQQTDPNVTLYAPSVNGLSVSVNGFAQAISSGASITTVNWQWGDGLTSNGLFPQTHIYNKAGTYTITVTVTDSNGLSNSASEIISTNKSSSLMIIVILFVVALILIAGVVTLLIIRRRKSKKKAIAETKPVKETASKSVPMAKTSTMEASDPANRLQRLKVMLDKGLITQQDYDEQKKKILEEYTK
jgi:PKD repeat protein